MTGRRKSPDTNLIGKLETALPAASTYEVGYGRPPKQTRFRKGQSGNPKGRPKGAKNRTPALSEERLKSIVLEEAYRTIGVRDGHREVKVPMAQAVIRSLAINAAKGQLHAQRLFTELLSATEHDQRRLQSELLDAAITYKIEWEQELERRRSLGIVAPDPIPHPDHVKIDFSTGQVAIRGPMTMEDKTRLDEWRARKADFEEELAELRQMLADKDDRTDAETIRQEIARTERLIELVRMALPD